MAKRQLQTALIALLSSLTLVACGGGGGGSPTPTPTPTPTTSNPTNVWTQGVFEPANNFKSLCQAPRSGVDIEGNAFDDRQGSLEDEKFWLRSWTNETYLWNNEVTDQNPAGFATPADYFNVLKTTATTPSGEDKDDFHFHVDTADYLADRNAAATSGYGARFRLFASTPPRDVRVLYTEANSPASDVSAGEAPFQRGAIILEIDGVDVVNADSDAAVATLNAGLFPATAGETHTFVVQDPGETPRTVTVTSADVSSSAVNTYRVINRGADKIGYILLNTFGTFSSEQEVFDAVTDLRTQGIDDLVLDLRYNGGGLLAVASQLSYMIAGSSATSGKYFEQLRFNADAGNINPVTGELNDPIPFYTTGVGFTEAPALPTSNTPLPTLDLPNIYILSTGSTCSASEAVINGLRGIGVNVVLIGDTTCGKPFGFYPQDNCGETWFTIQFQGTNFNGFGDFADGFIPQNSNAQFGVQLNGCHVSDDLNSPLGDTSEGLLSAALQYRDNATCPTPPATTVSGNQKLRSSADAESALQDPAERSAALFGRDLRLPQKVK